MASKYAYQAHLLIASMSWDHKLSSTLMPLSLHSARNHFIPQLPLTQSPVTIPGVPFFGLSDVGLIAPSTCNQSLIALPPASAMSKMASCVTGQPLGRLPHEFQVLGIRLDSCIKRAAHF
jgi:hypothetical protein